MKVLVKILCLASGILFSVNSFAEAVVVIVNAKNTETLSQSAVKAIYSDIRYTWENGEKIKLFELPVKASARSVFTNKVLNKSAIEAEGDWSNRKVTNTIKNRPKIKRDKLVVKFVAKSVNAVGYVPASLAAGNDKIRVILTLD